ncbi:hypothetical protein FRC02_009011 [Tulasnella sp. 418]|nr:hypothetical protein FRC02_009011 [Tulasnella sp. 418]
MTVSVLLSVLLLLLTFSLSRVRRWWSLGNRLPIAKPQQKRSQEIAADLGDRKSQYFEYPEIKAIGGFNLESQLPIPYRPFKWGPNYHITMGLRQADWNEWIELDNKFADYHALKAVRIQKRGDRCVQTLPARDGVPGGHDPAKEVAFELAEYLCRRYPDVYQVQRRTPAPGDYGWYGDGEIQTISINHLNVSYDLQEEDPMKVAGLLVQDDLAIMVEGSDGLYYLQAGSICLAGSWRLEDKIGLPLRDIHIRGNVPQYKEKLETSMDRYFAKLKTDRLVLRNNYFFQVVRRVSSPNSNPAKDYDPNELSWSYCNMGDEDAYAHGIHGKAKDLPPPDPSEIYFRTERQSLRRLPRTGAILFTIRTYLTPVTEMASEPGVPGRMASAVRSWPEDVALYKGQKIYKDSLLDYLDEQHEKQVASGVDWQTHKYPY